MSQIQFDWVTCDPSGSFVKPDISDKGLVPHFINQVLVSNICYSFCARVTQNESTNGITVYIPRDDPRGLGGAFEGGSDTKHYT